MNVSFGLNTLLTHLRYFMYPSVTLFFTEVLFRQKFCIEDIFYFLHSVWTKKQIMPKISTNLYIHENTTSNLTVVK